MKIYNKTVYNAEQMATFIGKVLVTAYKVVGWTWQPPIPSEVKLYYYTPSKKTDEEKQKSSKKGRKPNPYTFVAVRERRGCNPHRVGIVKPNKLYKSPMEALAAQADGEKRLPRHVLSELAFALVRELSRASYRVERTWSDSDWEWINDFVIEISDGPIIPKMDIDSRIALASKKVDKLSVRRHELENLINEYRDLIHRHANEVEAIREKEEKARAKWRDLRYERGLQQQKEDRSRCQ